MVDLVCRIYEGHTPQKFHYGLRTGRIRLGYVVLVTDGGDEGLYMRKYIVAPGGFLEYRAELGVSQRPIDSVITRHKGWMALPPECDALF